MPHPAMLMWFSFWIYVFFRELIYVFIRHEVALQICLDDSAISKSLFTSKSISVDVSRNYVLSIFHTSGISNPTHCPQIRVNINRFARVALEPGQTAQGEVTNVRFRFRILRRTLHCSTLNLLRCFMRLALYILLGLDT